LTSRVTTSDFRLTVLLGAGASRDAGLPMTGELTRQIVKRLQVQGELGGSVRALNYVCSALIGHRGVAGGDPFADLDVERVFSAVQLLAERHTHEAAPFVNAWHPGVGAFDVPSARPASGHNLEKLLDQVPLQPGAGGDLEREIAAIARGAVAASGDGTVYRRLESSMLAALCAVLSLPADADLSYLDPLVNLAKTSGGLDVATLNYDRVIEQACVGRVDVDTGISPEPADAWDWSTEGLRLLKLHGSVDWYYGQAPASMANEGFLPQKYPLVGVDAGSNPAPS